MNILKDLLEKYRQKRERFNEVEREMDIQRKIEQKQKSADDRELERYMEEERKVRVKKELERRRKIANDNMWRSTPVLRANRAIIQDNKLFLRKRSLLSW